VADIPLLLREVGDRAVVAAYDCANAGGWGLDVLGIEDRLVFSLREPELLRDACRIMQDAHLQNLRAMLEQGIEVVFDSWFQCGLSVGWSPRCFTDIFLPLIAETARLAHEYGAVYIGYDAGKMMATIPLLIEAGVDVIAGLQPPDIGDVVLSEAKARFGDRVALMGGLDPVYLLQWGTPERIRETVKQAIAEGGPGGGYVLHTAMSPDPQTTPECLRAAVQAVHDFGVYGRDL
jgi:uroporphyrinogen decarboxylase